jgi:ribonucleoside-triphosphate reductase
MTVTKHDGRKEPFKREKIENAVAKAAKSAEVGKEIASEISFDRDVTVDEIHDAVEKKLMEKYPDVAKAYILYRQKRTDYRLGKTDMVKGIDGLLLEASKDNANSENSMASKAHFVAEHVLKETELLKMNPKYAENHRKGICYIHDLPYRHMSVNCFFSPLYKMLKEGFDNGTGYVRPPKHITTAGALASIILQSMQSNFFGGEGYVHWDTDLAPYAEGEYKRQVKQIKEVYGDGYVNYEKVYELAMKRTRDAVFQAMQAFVYNANTQKARSGGQNVFSSINFGTDTSFWGRMISEMTLKAFMDGMGNGEMPFFPVLCFRLKKGINLYEGDPNFDLTMLALDCVGIRIMPRFVLADSDMYKDKMNCARMGCRTNVGTNINGDSSPEARGNLAFDTVNLPYLALLAKEKNPSDPLSEFWDILHEAVSDAIGELHERYGIMCSFKAKDFPFASKWYMGHENLKDENDSMEKCFRNGSLSVGYIGLAECLIALTGKHHGESEKSQELGLEIIKHMKAMTDKATQKYHVAYAVFSTPAENACFTLMNKTKKRFGVVKGVTDHDFFTNSCHIPVWAGVDAKKKIDIEGKYHLLALGGSIFYLEVGQSPKWNKEGLLDILQYAAEKKEIGYMGFNFAMNFCHKCHYKWDGDEMKCPWCGSSDLQRVAIVTGYLADVNRWNDGKLSELDSRKRNL